MKEPHWVCRQCGIAANTLSCLIKFGRPPLKEIISVATFHIDKCDVCGGVKSVTEARDFFYPDFSLLSVKYKNRVKLNNQA